MEILFVAPYLPTPPRFGGQRRLDGLMRELAGRHDVSVLSFNTTDPYTELSVAATQQYCREVHTFSDLDQQALADKRRLQALSLLSRHSYEYVLATRRRDFQKKLDALLQSGRFDVVQVEFAQMAAYDFAFQARSRPLLVLDEHNIEYDLQRRTAEAIGGASRFVYNQVNWRKLRAEERLAWRRFDGVVLTSVRDQAFVQDSPAHARSAVVPNGVDVDAFPQSTAEGVPDQLLFFGAINYYPNQDGLVHFIDEIMPLISSKRPSSKLWIVGPGARQPIHDRARGSVELLGFVDDVNVYLDQAAVVVVPLRIGGGTRLKIVEAMSKGKAIVSTSVGAEGLDVVHGEHLLLADEPREFAAQVERLLGDAELRKKLGDSARKLAATRYSWRAVVVGLERFYEELLETRGAARAL